MDEEAPRERTRHAEWNRSLDKFWWINEAERRIQENLANMWRPGGYLLVDEYMMLIEICFINFEHACKKDEVNMFYGLRDECRNVRDRIAKEASIWQSMGRDRKEGAYIIRREDIDVFVSFFRLLCKLQAKHGLGIKTTVRTTFEEQERNVLGEG